MKSEALDRSDFIHILHDNEQNNTGKIVAKYCSFSHIAKAMKLEWVYVHELARWA